MNNEQIRVIRQDDGETTHLVVLRTVEIRHRYGKPLPPEAIEIISELVRDGKMRGAVEVDGITYEWSLT